MKPIRFVNPFPGPGRQAENDYPGMIHFNFQPYNTQQLEQILKSQLANAKEGLTNRKDKDVIAPDGIKFAAMKVSSITGDARRVLDICRSVSS